MWWLIFEALLALAVLVLAERALSAEQVAAAFSGVRAGTVDELLELLVMMGQVRQVGTETVAYAA